MLLPRISDVLQCEPSTIAQQQMTQLTLDVSKAHRRILIDPKDGGLCFHANGEVYRCVTLNSGARASGWYWGRVAGLMVRTSPALLAYGHVLWQHVDNLLAWIDRVSALTWCCSSFWAFPCRGTRLRWLRKLTGLVGVSQCHLGRFQFHLKNSTRSCARSDQFRKTVRSPLKTSSH